MHVCPRAYTYIYIIFVHTCTYSCTYRTCNHNEACTRSEMQAYVMQHTYRVCPQGHNKSHAIWDVHWQNVTLSLCMCPSVFSVLNLICLHANIQNTAVAMGLASDIDDKQELGYGEGDTTRNANENRRKVKVTGITNATPFVECCPPPYGQIDWWPPSIGGPNALWPHLSACRPQP